jgi:hypothetical protein
VRCETETTAQNRLTLARHRATITAKFDIPNFETHDAKQRLARLAARTRRLALVRHAPDMSDDQQQTRQRASRISHKSIQEAENMHRFMTVGATLISVLSLTAVLAGSAIAALPEFLPGTESTIGGTSGKSSWQIQGAGTIKCEKDKPLGKILGPKTAQFDIHYEGCKAVGFAANSPGDKAGVILVLYTGRLCPTSKASKTVGMVKEVSPTLVIEVPTAKQKIEVKGAVIGDVKPINKSQTTGELVFTQKEGKPGIEKCEGEAASVLLAKEAEKEFKPAGEEGVESLEYSSAVEVMA